MKREDMAWDYLSPEKRAQLIKFYPELDAGGELKRNDKRRLDTSSVKHSPPPRKGGEIND